MRQKAVNYDLAVIINTCDAYKDVLTIFFHAFNEYWPNCPYTLVINTQTNKYNYSAIVHNYINSDKRDDWGGRLLSTLKSINNKYVLMLYDDFILNSSVCNKSIVACLDLLEAQPQAAVTYLINTSLPLVNPYSQEQLVKLENRIHYRLNSAPAIWRKQDLEKYTMEGDNPWAWEVFGTYRTWDDGKEFYSLNPQFNDIYPFDYSKGGAIYRGKWVRDVVDQVSKKYLLDIDWNIRGFSSNEKHEKRSLFWKLRFMAIGYRMVGIKALFFLSLYIRAKLNAKR